MYFPFHCGMEMSNPKSSEFNSSESLTLRHMDHNYGIKTLLKETGSPGAITLDSERIPNKQCTIDVIPC